MTGLAEQVHSEKKESRALEARSADIPLVVDLDGTLIHSDMMVEAVCSLLAGNVLSAFMLPFWLLGGKAAFKSRVAERSMPDVATLPYNQATLELIRDARAEGRKVYLASAADIRHVEAVADHLGLFDGIFSSDGKTNLGGANKAAALVEAFGKEGFDYVADAPVDVAVWAKANAAYVVEPTPSLLKKAGDVTNNIYAVGKRPSGGARWKALTKALRPHQWAKNALIFLPPLAAHEITPAIMGDAVLAFIAFSLCASGVYLLNDLMDLPHDRRHHSKYRRPFASGTLSLKVGMVLTPLLTLAAVGIAFFLPWQFLGVLGIYYVATLSYSFYLKRRMIVDVMTLGGLYTIRVFAGAAATGIEISPWLLAFSMFLFLCLAIVKRQTELVQHMKQGKGALSGRGYHVEDLEMLRAMGAASGYVAVLVLALYINSLAVLTAYARPWALWGLCIILLYWISRALMLAHRGEMHDDPVVFAIKDRISQATGLLALLCLAIATV